LFSSADHGEDFDGWSNQRGARALQLLASDEQVSLAELRIYALDIQPFGVERWQAALRDAFTQSTSRLTSERLQQVIDWDGQLARDSAAALVYAYWRIELQALPAGEAIRAAIDDPYAQAAGRAQNAVALSGAQLQVLRESFVAAETLLRNQFGAAGAVYGDVFRVGRNELSWPVGGGRGDQFGLAALRSVGFSPVDADSPTAYQRVGYRGQTSTQVVELSTPIKSYLYLPVGQSDRKDSPHYTDQARLLFSARQLKPSWWLPEDLVDHIASRMELSVPEHLE
jgi:acyl-homoserine lactone acylase PvdQ